MMTDRDFVRPFWVGALIVYGALLIVVLLALSFREWPESLPVNRDRNPETQFLTLAAIFGALGGSVRMIISLVVFAGNRRLLRSWVPWFLMDPVVGLVLGVLIYFLVRGGFIMDAGSLNPFGVAALSGLVGMFGKRVITKLTKVFYALFRQNSVQ